MSVEIGYSISSEETAPTRCVGLARAAEQAGFPFAVISDHYHPWIDRQGQSPFVWAVIGGIAQATSSLRLGTAVTCPTIRIHPAIIAQAAATAACLMPGRFFLGVGSGENLNEHILGDTWPRVEVRQAMLEEAVGLIRLLWTGGEHSFDGDFYELADARVYSLPDELPPIYVAASGADSAELAARIGDGLIGVAPVRQTVETFEQVGKAGRPRYGQVTVCWAPDERAARRTALEWWPTAAIRGDASQELPRPKHFEQLASMVREEDVAGMIACGPDPDVHLARIQSYVDAGYDHLFVHQVGPDQEGFMDFYREQILPRFAAS